MLEDIARSQGRHGVVEKALIAIQTRELDPSSCGADAPRSHQQ